MRVDIFDNPEIVFNDTQNRSIGIGYVQKIEPDKNEQIMVAVTSLGSISYFVM